MKRFISLILLVMMLAIPLVSFAGDAMPTVAGNAEAIKTVQTNADFLWTLVAAFMVFFMQAGFAMVEAGFTRAKNAVNIIMKNLMDMSLGAIAYWAIGFALMFGVSKTGWFGTTGFFLSDYVADKDPWTLAFWMFQVVFAATAATIVSGAMAERTKFISYLIYSVVISGLIYPIFGSWAWGSLYKGSGWLEGLGFIDFAGSTVVHSVGGWAALAGAIVIGPRIGKYVNGKAKAIPGHSITIGALGVFILWFGWYGFNAGSTTAANTDTALIAVNTTLAACAGAFGAMVISWIKFKKPDATMTLNGTLAGLVGITAGCANVLPGSAILIGLLAGVIVVFAVIFIDQTLKVDDPVGAISVHGVCGAWGTLAAGLFNAGGVTLKIVGVQLLGIGAAFLWVFPTAFVLFKLIDKTIGLRTSPEEELEGLDIGEHGLVAYPDFQVNPEANG
ncbi:MAG TPA: ammonium transporter [Nitrospirae bacterium]|nr:ammonia channel precursor [bacterium BMS3Bbin09]HDH34000.1 ammonium transporter [Nitrospirota bacterium]HDN94947.1 ammonium transporter [Nitrospirota bacterium]HDO66947.1 ammonium transporter [Nitrospirota bacterium]HEW81121.1 ammonium transporter [Nitrospirota bacterium]